jgi:hypothetical protein
MPVKSTLKKTKVKKVATAPKKNDEEDEVAESIPVPGKVKVPIEIDEPDTAPIIDEKAEEDPLVAEVEDELADDSGIEDELDPFGDKWEA